ncbi:unnamed protein product [Peronospora belbahrii]|uniref:Uncharacterized protein n=1 Tax=Peronospora belbahrii TaxID=622444 RepID=A0AAU9KZC0_9STRA|nr:unnamed protein product [Peronospora belbahrii]
MSNDKTPEEVFKILGLANQKTNPLTHPKFALETDFMDLYNEERPDSQTTVSEILIKERNLLSVLSYKYSAGICHKK